MKYKIICELTIKSNFIRQMSSLHGQIVYVYDPAVVTSVSDKVKYVLFTDDVCPVVRTTVHNHNRRHVSIIFKYNYLKDNNNQKCFC